MVLDASLLNLTQNYKMQIKGKWSNPGKGVALFLHLSEVAIESQPTYIIYIFYPASRRENSLTLSSAEW